MDLQQLHAQTGIDLRKLRYCLDHELVPGLRIAPTPGEAGRPRKFAEDVGFGIVCAARLLELGLPHKSISGFLEGMLRCRIARKGCEKPALLAVLEQTVPATAQLGDGKYIRIRVPEYGYDSGWVSPNHRVRGGDYRPIVIVELDIGQIRDQVFLRR